MAERSILCCSGCMEMKLINDRVYFEKSPLDSGSSSPQDWAAHHILGDYVYPVTCLAWSLDDSILLTSADHYIRLWNTKMNNLL